METVKSVLIERDGLDEKNADKLISEAKNEFYERLENGEMPYDFCEEYFGLEPDYLEDFLF